MTDGREAAADGETLETQSVHQLAMELAEAAAKQYRIEVEAAYAIIWGLWAKEAALWEQATRVPEPPRLKRTRPYKEAANRAKTAIYYGLRRYRQDEDRLARGIDTLHELASTGARAEDPPAQAARDAIVGSHVSTRERVDDLDSFFASLFALVPEPSSILDLGCGVQPLLYPFAGAGRSTAFYLGLDRDAMAVEAVNAWAPLLDGIRLEARRWTLSEGFESIAGAEPAEPFDLALGLKLVPVVARQERDRLAVLRNVPARRFLVTGSRQAMVKRRSIERREERTLRAFAEAQHFALLGTLETETEIGLLLEKC